MPYRCKGFQYMDVDSFKMQCDLQAYDSNVLK